MKISAKPWKNIYVLSFCIPVLLMLGIFVERGIFPFGNNSFMFSDMYHQYVPFLTEFWRKLHEGESLAFSWRIGLGSDFFAVYAYYLASPFNWLAYFCPEKYLIEFMTYFIVLKIGFCGVSFTHYLRRHFHTKDLRIVWFSVFYAMSGFMAAYSWNHMWMDCLWLAPLIILGLEELVLLGKKRRYCLLLALCILTNYYLSILICIFLVFYFLYLLFTNGLSLRKKGAAVLHFTLTSLLAGGMAGVLLYPVMLSMQVTDFHDISFPKSIVVYFNALEMLARHVPMLPTERGLDHWPNIYCGVLAFILVPVYFFHRRIPLKQKLGKLVLLAVMLLAFSVNILNFIWHGLNYPDSLPARQSFLYILVVLTMCFEAVHRNGENKNINRMAGILAGVLLLAACGIFVKTDGLTVAVMASAWIFLAGYLFLFVLFDKRLQSKKHLSLRLVSVYGKWVILLLVCVEAVLNMEHTGVRPVQKRGYLAQKSEYAQAYETVKEPYFTRFESYTQMTKNDGALSGYPSVSVFSSTTNGHVEDFYTALGMGGSKVSYYYKGATPFTSALLGVGYTFWKEEARDEVLYEKVAKTDSLYLYRHRLTLPVGFCVSSEVWEKWQTILNEQAGNALNLQNRMALAVGADPLFTAITRSEMKTEENRILLRLEEDGHLYGVVSKTPEEEVMLTVNDTEQGTLDVNSKYLLDLGWYEAGTILSLEGEESLSLRFYRLNEEALAEALTVLGREPLLAEVGERGLTGEVNLKEDGYLFLSVPKEPGWTLWVDGRETEAEALADTLMGIPLSAGSHDILLQYSLRGLHTGLLMSLVSLLGYLLLYERKKSA